MKIKSLFSMAALAEVSVFQLLETQRQVTQAAIAYVDTLPDYWQSNSIQSNPQHPSQRDENAQS